MLIEPEVIQSVCEFLTSRGFSAIKFLCETERGIDIQALAPDGKQQITIEAKGETSSKSTTSRYGQPFNSGQVLDHVSKAFYCAARDCDKFLAGIALPKNPSHLRGVRDIEATLERLQIEVFWVLPDRSVETGNIWPIWQQLNGRI